MKKEKDLTLQLEKFINEAEEEKKSLENKIENLTNRIKNLKETYQFLLEKTGKRKTQGRFVNVKLGDALETLIKEHGTVTVEELIEELETEGYEFKAKERKKPRKPQTVKFTLLNKSNIDKTQKDEGIYKWIGK